MVSTHRTSPAPMTGMSSWLIRTYTRAHGITCRRHNSFMAQGLREFKEWHYKGFMEGNSVEEKERWLANMIDNDPQAVDTEAFLIVIRALVHSGLADAPLRAERWVGKLERLAYESPQETALLSSSLSTSMPNPECYQRVIEAWGRADSEDPAIAVTRAERWLVKNLNNPNPLLRPNTSCFNAFLDVCSTGRALKGTHNTELVRRHAIKAESTLQYMMEQRKVHGKNSVAAPDTDSFNFVIRAWTRCRRNIDVADRATEVLRLLEHYELTVDGTVKPNHKSFAMVLDSIAVRAKIKVKRCRNKQQDWSYPDKNGLNEINIINDAIKYQWERAIAGEPDLLPGTVAYNTLMSAWSHFSWVDQSGPLEAEKVLQHMISLKDQGTDGAAPDALSYLIVMRCWMNSELPNRGQRVEWWLSKQWKDYEFEGREELKPTVDSYNASIRTHERMGEPDKAERLFSELLRRSEMDASGNLHPNSESFAAVVRAWLVVADEGSKEGLERAVLWLDSLVEREHKEMGVVSTVELYTAVLRAARSCAPMYPEVLDIAVETLDKLRASRHTVGCLHYSRLLQVGLFAMSRAEHKDVRTAFVTQIVDDCAEDGLISAPLLRAISNGPAYYDGWTVEESARVTETVFPDWPLPYSWTRNVKQQGHTPSRSDLKRTGYDIARHGNDPYRKMAYK